MKIVSWNIRHGGTKSRLAAIQDQLRLWDPDVVGLSEFRGSATSQAIAASLAGAGLLHQRTTADADGRGVNFLMLASRFPIELQTSTGLLADSGRWLHVKIRGVHIISMHVPNRSDAKWQFHREVIERFEELRSVPAVAFGDTNTGLPEVDEENKFFNKKEAAWFQRIKEAQWQDVWRERNPHAREFTWYSHRDNGFRLDQAFAPNDFAAAISNIRHDWGAGGRDTKLSDHAAIVFDLAEDSVTPS